MPFFETSDGTSLHYVDGGIGRNVAYLLSDRVKSVRGQTIHLRAPEQVAHIA